jgi:Domain of unknown function (DUF4936)
MRSLYIYYRVQPAQKPELWLAVSDMQTALRGQMPGLAASLSQKLDTPPASEAPLGAAPQALLTWMETYHFNGHASTEAWERFELTLSQRAACLPAGIEGPRHVERFERLSAPCLTPSPTATNTDSLKD